MILSSKGEEDLQTYSKVKDVAQIYDVKVKTMATKQDISMSLNMLINIKPCGWNWIITRLLKPSVMKIQQL